VARSPAFQIGPGQGQRQRTIRVDPFERYIVNNRDRMDYPGYRAVGLRVGGGAIESANFHVTGREPLSAVSGE